MSVFDRDGGTGRGAENDFITGSMLSLCVAARVVGSLEVPGTQAHNMRQIGKVTRRMSPPKQ